MEYTESGRVLLCKNSDVARKILIKRKRKRDYTDTLSSFFKTESEYAIVVYFAVNSAKIASDVRNWGIRLTRT